MRNAIMTFFAAIVCAATLLGCNSGGGNGKITKESFCGKKWHGTKMEAQGKSEAMKDDKSYYQYNTDGTMAMVKGELTDKYSYDYDDASKTISIKGSDGNVNCKQEILKVDDKNLEMNQTLVGLGVTMKVYMEAQP